MKRQQLVSIGVGAMISALAFVPLAMTSPARAQTHGATMAPASLVAPVADVSAGFGRR